MKLVVLPLLLVLAAQASVAVSVKDFGAKGDGVTDDYDALQAAAAYLCQNPGITLVFPPATYRINRYRIIGGRAANSVRNIRYTHCVNVTILGYGAKIDVKGDFRRVADPAHGSSKSSLRDGVIPFEMVDSSGFTIAGFELDGNVDQMTRDNGVAEGSNAGILTTNCSRYTIQDIYVHHFPTDGITLGGNSELADRNATISHVVAANNARQGLSIIQVRDAIISNSVFRLSGRTGGAYGNHPPSAGVDVEPVRAPPQEDLKTGGLLFDDCLFQDNLGLQFVSGWPDKVDTVTVQNSSISAPHSDGDICAFLNVAVQAATTGNTFDIAVPHAVCLSLISVPLYGNIQRLTFAGNTLNLGRNDGIQTAIQQAPVDFTGNTVGVRATASDSSVIRLDYLNRVENNRFFIAAAGWSGVHDTVTYEKGVVNVRGNTYTTDLTGSKFYEVYYGSGILCGVETFPSPNFKPVTRCQAGLNYLALRP